MSNAFLVAKDGWVQGLVPSSGTLIGHVGPPRVFYSSGIGPYRDIATVFHFKSCSRHSARYKFVGIDVSRRGWGADVRDTFLRPPWGPWLQGLS